ncbi:MAG TPA: hypothetical protein VEC36_00005, partial [Patescibacteria group bacterium]|nr:hypothetical protein [Patescibacteria group bacterium]
LLAQTPAPNYAQSISALFDTTGASPFLNSNLPAVLGLESIEFQNLQDTSALAYIMGFDHRNDTVALVGRLIADLRSYKPNYFAGLRPIFGINTGADTRIFAIANMSRPQRDTTDLLQVANFFRGLTQFNLSAATPNILYRNISDNPATRFQVTPQILPEQPSMTQLSGGRVGLLLPIFPDITLKDSLTNSQGISTQADIPYLINTELQGTQISTGFQPRNLSYFLKDTTNSRPQIRPYYVQLDNSQGSEQPYIVIAEEYTARDSSRGVARLHLFKADGTLITSPDSIANLPFKGGRNHLWQIAQGNLDGTVVNENLPFYPNNTGREIIATQTSREFAFAASRLFVLRYREGTRTPKPFPTGTFLQPLDTICSFKINGYIAAVNDFDGAPDGKDEIFIVNGSELTVLKMRDYSNTRFLLGEPFETVFTHDFGNENITALQIADLEGDGFNDLIITTSRQLYVFGKFIPNSLRVLDPIIQQTPFQSYCAGDSLMITFTNITAIQSGASIYFQEYLANSPSGARVLLDSTFKSTTDTSRYTLIPDARIFGKSGRFIVEENRFKNSDSTAILQFAQPALTITQSPLQTATVGDVLTIDGTTECVDSVIIQYRERGGTWQPLKTEAVSSNAFLASFLAPCVSFFECLGRDRDSVIFVRAIGTNRFKNAADTSAIYSVRILPQKIAVQLAAMPGTLCPERTLSWSAGAIACDSMSISYSADGGATFTEIFKSAQPSGSFMWQQPAGLPEQFMIRFCCGSSCLRTDTLISNTAQKLIQTVAPNPFSPTAQVLEVFYTLPQDANVTLRIYDQSDRLIAEPAVNITRTANTIFCERWDGTTLDGKLVPNGMYYMVLETSGGMREVYNVFVRKRF